MKRKIICLLLILILFCQGISVFANRAEVPLVDSSEVFEDVESDAWYKTYIDYALTYGILEGVDQGVMKPESNITRAQFVQVLANFEGVDTDDKNVATDFIDVCSGDWFAPAIKWAFDNGIVNGVSAISFDPNGYITREQLCTMLIRYSTYKYMMFNVVTNDVEFTDSKDISAYAKSSVELCTKAGIINGIDGAFKPTAQATRAQVAAIMTRFDQSYTIRDISL